LQITNTFVIGIEAMRFGSIARDFAKRIEEAIE
jgi:hypothetical protein